MLMSLFTRLQSVATDPVKFRAAIKVFNDRLGEDSHLILNPRWPGVYPDPCEPRCFVMIPFRDDLKRLRTQTGLRLQSGRNKLILPTKPDLVIQMEINCVKERFNSLDCLFSSSCPVVARSAESDLPLRGFSEDGR